MAKRNMVVGMDVHKGSIDVSVAEDGRLGDRLKGTYVLFQSRSLNLAPRHRDHRCSDANPGCTRHQGSGRKDVRV